MDYRLRDRLTHIVDTIAPIELLVQDRSLDDFRKDRASLAALERFFEIPEARKLDAPEIPWRQIADIGNHLRHAYPTVNPTILLNIHESGQLAALKNVLTGGCRNPRSIH